MLRRRLFVIGIISFAAGITAAAAEPANLRKFYVTRGAKTDCTEDPDGTIGSSTLCRRDATDVNVDKDTENFATIRNTTFNVENAEKKITGVTDETKEISDDTAIDEGRRKKGGKRGLMKVFVMMAAAAKATLLYAKIHAVAFLAAKALVVAKVALALAAAVALKKALEHHDKTSYEIVKHPHHSYVQTHSSSVDYDHHGGGGGGGGYEGSHRRRRRHAR